MPKAVGFSQTLFSSKKIGNLCRGKEWWIESEAPQREKSLHRIIISGVELQDERARRAQRGLAFSGKNIAEFLAVISEGKSLIACVEDASPHQVPMQASGVEHYRMSKRGFALQTWFTRWELNCDRAENISDALVKGADLFLMNATTATEEETKKWKNTIPPEYDQKVAPSMLNPQLKMDVHRLIGGRQFMDSSARYVADAIWDVLEECEALVLLHEDKHGRCLGVYSKEQLEISDRLNVFCQASKILFVPFSIPPMLARWDRAIRDLRRDWNEEEQGEFPIPISIELPEEVSIEEESEGNIQSDPAEE